MALVMNLKEARELFKKIKGKCEIFVKPHAWSDHPKRCFSAAELDRLVRKAGGLHSNISPEAIANSFKILVNDEADRRCDIIILFEILDNEVIVVCSAYREV